MKGLKIVKYDAKKKTIPWPHIFPKLNMLHSLMKPIHLYQPIPKDVSLLQCTLELLPTLCYLP